MCIDPHQTGSVGKGSDHLQLIKFWPSRTPGKGSVVERNFLALSYYSQCAVFASPLSVFSHWFSKIGISGIPAISTAISVYNGSLSWISVKLVPTCQLMIALCSCLVDLILGWHLWCCYILPFCCALISVCFICILCMLVVYCHINQYYKALYLGCPGILQIGTWNYSVSLRFHGHFSRWTYVSRFYWS